MVLNGDDFLAQLLDTFRGEAHEHLSAMAAGLLILEQSETPREEYETTIEQVFRETHSLKGAARAVGLREIENLCQQQESVFSAVRKGTLILHPEDFDLFHSVIRTLERLLAEEKGVKITDLLTRLRKLIACAEKENPEKLSKDKTLSQEESGGIVHPEKLSSPAILTVNEKEPSPVSIQDKSLKPPLEEDKEVKPKGSPAGIAAINHEVHAASDSDGNVKNQRIEKPEISVDEPDILLTPPEESKVYKQDPPTAIKDDDIMQTQHISKGGGMIKIASDRLEKLFTKADDLMGARLAAGQRSTSLRELSQNFLHWRWAWTQISTDIEHLRTQTGQETSGSLSPLPAEIERINGFLDYNRAFIKTLETDITTLTRAATRDQYLLDTATTELIDEIKQVILVPAASLLDTYPRAARDLARDSGKDVDVLISGAEIEIDRRILDGIRDPIMHIIRNSIDHGIEEPDIRQSKGKSKRGQIRISVIHVRGHQAEIRIADDGAGIDVQRVSSAAVTKGLISAEEVSRMENSQIFRYIFKSGLSTKKIVTTVSGRGLGLAIALEKVEQIGGTVRVISSDKGTEFVLTLPLSLATFRGIKVFAGGHPFFIPLRSIDRVMQIINKDIKTIESRAVLEIDNEPIAVVSLAKILGYGEENGKKSDTSQLVIASASGIRYGLLVDQISGAQEIVVKNLGQQLRRVRHISGASILGDGMVVPVINCEDLAATISGMEHLPSSAPIQSSRDKQRSILVVEDSITSRMLLKNILEGAGYLVETAVDGVDAMMKLKLNPVDIVVSDVDMPRMNGFVLTEKIRADPTYADIPVILVTSLDSREDREHGITVGASAYIVKSSFDQSNLLEVISRNIQ